MTAWPNRSIFWDIVDRVDLSERLLLKEAMLEVYPISRGRGFGGEQNVESA